MAENPVADISQRDNSLMNEYQFSKIDDNKETPFQDDEVKKIVTEEVKHNEPSSIFDKFNDTDLFSDYNSEHQHCLQ